MDNEHGHELRPSSHFSMRNLWQSKGYPCKLVPVTLIITHRQVWEDKGGSEVDGDVIITSPNQILRSFKQLPNQNDSATHTPVWNQHVYTDRLIFINCTVLMTQVQKHENVCLGGGRRLSEIFTKIVISVFKRHRLILGHGSFWISVCKIVKTRAEKYIIPLSSPIKTKTFLKKIHIHTLNTAFYMGQVTKLRLSCYMVLLSIDSKTR